MIDCIVKISSSADENEIEKEVFATVESVTQNEFFSAAQSGFRSEYKITLWASDYNNQDTVILPFSPLQYSIYRRYYRNDEKVELYLSDRVVDY